MMNRRRLHNRLATLFGTAMIFAFFSEFFFFNEGPVNEIIASLNNPEELFWKMVELILLYSIVTAPFLWIVTHYNIQSTQNLFLAAAIFGYFVEGLMVPVMYFELPFSLLWTSLSWHPIVDVLFGWIFIQHTLNKNNLGITILLALALGVTWGVWATWPVGSKSDVDDSIIIPLTQLEFATVAFTSSTMWILGIILINKLGSDSFQTGKVEFTFFSLVLVFLFVVVLLTVNILGLILPLFVLMVLLRLNKEKTSSKKNIINIFGTPISFVNYLALFLTPLTATYTYRLCTSYHLIISPAVAAIPLIIASIAFLIRGLNPK